VTIHSSSAYNKSSALTTFRILTGLLVILPLRMDLAYGQEQSAEREPPALAQAQPAPAQEQPAAKEALSNRQLPPIPPGFTEMTSKHFSAPCLEPDKLPGMSEYDGPMKKMVGIFAHALERQSVFSHPDYQGAMLCDFGAKDKFKVFLAGSIEPILLLTAAFDAGIDQASNRDPTFGLGAVGYAKRFAADYTDWESGRFFKGFLYPVIFREDPRYYRLGQGPTGRRLKHAAEHVFVAHHPDATHMFNYSEWLGSLSSIALSNTYHPGNTFTIGHTASGMALLIGLDAGFDVLREFWPEIARSMKLPFRGLKKQTGSGLETAP
jgi:hypothetical protein